MNKTSDTASLKALLEKGDALLEKGESEKAAKTLAGIVEKVLKEPLGKNAYSEALRQILGQTFQKLGEIQEQAENPGYALTAFLAARDLGVAQKQNARGILKALHDLGELKAALKEADKALETCKDDFTLLRLKANTLRKLEKYKETLPIYEDLLEKDQAGAELELDYALALEGAGKTAEAYAIYLKLRTGDRGLFDALIDKADEKLARDFAFQARDYLEKASKIAPRHQDDFYYLGLRYNTLNLVEEAEKAYRKALNIAPTTGTLRDLALLLERSNRLEEALSVARMAVQFTQDDDTANNVLAKIELRTGEEDAAKDRLLKFHGKAEDPSTNAVIANHLGRIFDRKKNYDKAYKFYQESKDVQKNMEAFKEISPEEPFNTIKKITNLDFKTLPRTRSPKTKSWHPKQIVFFVGFPRSGTTLIQEVLQAHKKIVVVEEKPIMRSQFEFLGAFQKGYPQSLPELTQGHLEFLRDLYLWEAKNFIAYNSENIFVDKYPLNIIHLPFLLMVFPEAKVIFGQRHPMGACVSCLQQNFLLNRSMSKLMSPDEITNFYARIMPVWVKITKELEFEWHYVRYEKVVENLEREAKALTDFIGVEWDPGMLKYNERAKEKGIISTPSYQQVIKPIYKGSVDSWKNYAKYFKPYQDRLKPFSEFFGYEQ